MGVNTFLLLCKGFIKRFQFYFDYIDFFAMKPSDRITFQKTNIYSTFIGRLTSWILIGIYIVTFLNFATGMIYRLNPQFIYSEIVTSDPPNLNLNEIGFFMAFGLQDLRKKSANYIDKSVYIVELIKRTKKNGIITLENIPVGPCSLENVPDREDLKDYFKRNSIENLYCIMNTSEIVPELKSTWDGIYYKDLLINVYPCVNSTQNGNFCKSSEELKNDLNNSNFAIYFNTNAVDPTNFEQPVVSFGKQIYTPISSLTLTNIEILFSHFDFITDVGYLSEELQRIESANYLNNRQVLSFGSDMIVQVDMQLDKIKSVYNRKYDKLPQILASMGGIVKALTLFSSFFVYPFIELNFRLNLANTIFSFKTDKHANLIKKVKKMSIFNKSESGIHNLANMKQSVKFKKDSIAEKKGSIQLKNMTGDMKRMEFSKTQTTQVRISYFRYFLNCLSDKSSRTAKKMLKQSLNQIDEVLDISFIMKKLVEIDLLKLLLLTEEQNNLFNCLPKPEVGVGGSEKKKTLPPSIFNAFHSKLTYQDLKKSNDLTKAEKSFHSLMNKNKKSPVDQKLIDILNWSFSKKQKKQRLKSGKIEDKFKYGNKQLEMLLRTGGLAHVDTNRKIILFDDE